MTPAITYDNINLHFSTIMVCLFAYTSYTWKVKFISWPSRRIYPKSFLHQERRFYAQKQLSEQQEVFLQLCMGNRGLKVTYEPFFMKLFDPSFHPERLNRLLSAIMGQSLRVVGTHPREGLRLSDSSSLVIMDLLVELADGSLVNVEIQRCGYRFPIQRSFCYGADLLARQYAKLKAKKKAAFSYKDMHPVHVIVLMEESPVIFKKFPKHFIHHSRFSFDTGLVLESLLNFTYISLDIFHSLTHNDIEELDAWMYFLSSDEPGLIRQVVEKYPFFQELYQEIINFRYKPEELMNMYNEILAEMDKNIELESVTEIYDAKLAEKDDEIAKKDEALAEKDAEIARLKAALASQKR